MRWFLNLVIWVIYRRIPKRAAVERSISTHAAQISSLAEVNTLLTQVTETFTRARLAERLASLSPSPASAAPPGAVVNTAPVMGAEGLAPGIVAAGTGDRHRIGVLLPLSGPFAGYGRKAIRRYFVCGWRF